MAEDKKPDNIRNILVVAVADQSEVGSQGKVQTILREEIVTELLMARANLRKLGDQQNQQKLTQTELDQLHDDVVDGARRVISTSHWKARTLVPRQPVMDHVDKGIRPNLLQLHQVHDHSVDVATAMSAQTRALLSTLEKELLNLAHRKYSDSDPYSFNIDLLEAPPGPTGYHMDLQCALLNYLENRDIQCAIPNVPNYRYRYDRKSQFQYPVRPGRERLTPSVIVPIASAPTRAARAVVRRLSPGNKIPIVFTVVSDPGHEPSDDPLVNPYTFKAEGDGVTGVSRSLIQTVRKCLNLFRDLLGDDREIHWLIRPRLHQAAQAHQELTGDSSPDLHPTLPYPRNRTVRESDELWWHDITDLEKVEILQFVRDDKVLPPNDRRRSKRTGLLVIPDELVVSIAEDVIETAQRKRIPTFVQQLEYVAKGPWTKNDRFALAGYGLPPKTLGQDTAVYVDKVLRAPSPAEKAMELPVHFFSRSEFKFWINTGVADSLGIKIPPHVLAKAHPLLLEGSRVDDCLEISN